MLKTLALLSILSPSIAFSYAPPCAAKAVAMEAQGESLKGQRAVYDVLLYRSKQQKKSVCAVVREKRQFSWYRKGMSLKATQKELTAFKEVVKMNPVVFGKTHFYHYKAKPSWRKQCVEKQRIDNQIFCRIKEK